jgi:hypothetical protein
VRHGSQLLIITNPLGKVKEIEQIPVAQYQLPELQAGGR